MKRYNTHNTQKLDYYDRYFDAFPSQFKSGLNFNTSIIEGFLVNGRSEKSDRHKSPQRDLECDSPKPNIFKAFTMTNATIRKMDPLHIQTMSTPPKRRPTKAKTPLPREYILTSPKSHLSPRGPPQTKSQT